MPHSSLGHPTTALRLPSRLRSLERPTLDALVVHHALGRPVLPPAGHVGVEHVAGLDHVVVDADEDHVRFGPQVVLPH